MTDDGCCLKWEIDDALERFDTGRVESDVFHVRGFHWTFALVRRDGASGNPLNDTVDFSVHLAIDPKLGGKRIWKCEAEFIICLNKMNGKIFAFRPQVLFSLNERNSTYEYSTTLYWNTLVHPVYFINGKITIDFLISNMKSESEEIADTTKFAAPTNRSNVVLLVGENRLHVSKELLAINSPVFETLFFGDFIEKGKEEVEIKDVVLEEFLDLLNLIYPGTMTITDRTVLHVLKLSHLFQIEHLVTKSLLHLSTSKVIDVMQKLIAADLYCVDDLRDLCLNSFNSVEEITQQLKASQEYENFSAGMKVAICDRIMALTPEPNK